MNPEPGQTTTSLPRAMTVRDLLGRHVDVATGASMVNPSRRGSALVGIFVNRFLKLSALMLLDIQLAARAGAALALVPSRDRAVGLAYVPRLDLMVDIKGFGDVCFRWSSSEALALVRPLMDSVGPDRGSWLTRPHLAHLPDRPYLGRSWWRGTEDWSEIPGTQTT